MTTNPTSPVTDERARAFKQSFTASGFNVLSAAPDAVIHAALEAAFAVAPRQDDDTKRLEWLAFHSAHIWHSQDGEVCRVCINSKRGQDEWRGPAFDDWRKAIDHAMKDAFND